ncbi:lactose-specific PTS transporter subunit IIA [Leptotrichia alba]|uniref:PTS system lactose-specific EIIA component n=1 Tax=Leptotrichia alba TaxID=3239304 RepID=A0AB39V5P7_9FUSO
MTKEDVTMIGFEIVAYAGDARSKLMIALNKAQNGEFEEAENLVKEAENVWLAHNSQTDILAKEAAGEDLEMSFIMIHGQDHLMTTILLKELMKHLIELYKRGAK